MARKSKIEPEIEEIEYVSKTQLKQEAEDLKVLGETIIKLSPAQRAKLPLDDEMKEAMVVADKIDNTREAYRRHLQYVGRLLRSRDAEAIKYAIDSLGNVNKQAEKALQQIEKIRELLLKDGDAQINAMAAQYPDIERQKLRQLVKKTLKQQQQDPLQPSPAYRELFQYIKQIVK